MKQKRYRISLSRALAASLVEGPWDAQEVRRRLVATLRSEPPWLAELVPELAAAFASFVAPSLDEVAERIRSTASFRGLTSGAEHVEIRRWRLSRPSHATEATVGDLASLLGLSATELGWFCDLRRMNARAPEGPLRHYHYRWVEKRSAGYRLLETPKPRLKQLQRTIASRILSAVPPGPHAHGFVAGRSAKTYAEPHAAQPLVLRLDLEDFFASVQSRAVMGVFQGAGWSHSAARCLTHLVCSDVPNPVVRDHPRAGMSTAERFDSMKRLQLSHLPQGAPTSPPLSNIVARRLDRRLAGLADSVAYRYTRYADDLAFSGERRGQAWIRSFLARIGAIVADEGFAIRHRKTRVMSRAGAQQLAGLVVNERPQVRRDSYDLMRAILHNCLHHGHASQNRHDVPDFRAHLRGRIAWIHETNPLRGEKLLAVFRRIEWSPTPDEQE